MTLPKYMTIPLNAKFPTNISTKRICTMIMSDRNKSIGLTNSKWSLVFIDNVNWATFRHCDSGSQNQNESIEHSKFVPLFGYSMNDVCQLSTLTKYFDLVEWLKSDYLRLYSTFSFQLCQYIYHFGICRANSWRYFFVFSQQCSRDCWSHSFISPHSTHSLYRCEFSISAKSISFTLVGESWKLGNLICFIYLFFWRFFSRLFTLARELFPYKSSYNYYYYYYGNGN